jgi:long-chain acyl-CoA synthetase
VKVPQYLQSFGPGALVHHFLERSAARAPDKTAVVFEDTRASYSQIEARANGFASWLAANGTRKGDRVVLLLENSPDYIVGYYGALKAGAVSVPLSPDFKADALKPLLDEVEPSAIVSSARCEQALKELWPVSAPSAGLILKSPKLQWPAAAFDWEDVSAAGEPVVIDAAVAPSDLASIIYTSGSSGKPKGVMLSHANLVANVHSVCACLRIAQDDSQMVVLPFNYVMGKSLLNTHFAAGATVVINNNFAWPASVLKQMADEMVTSFSGVPSTYAYLLHRSPLAKYRDRLPFLRYCSQAGGHMADRIKTDLREVLPPHTDIFIMYGATEAAARLTCLEPSMFSQKLGSIGKPVLGVRIRVMGENGRDAGIGETGELVAAGPSIMMGYWKDPESTSKVLDADGYHTGDLGSMDADGYLFVTGRRDSLLKVGGYRVDPQEIEDAIIATGLAIECAVVGLDDPLQGKRLAAAAVVKEKSTSANDLLEACSHRLSKFKMPSEIKVIGKIPLNSNGKVDREACGRLFEEGQG